MKTKTIKITLESFGSYLGMEKGCFTVKNREGQIERYPLFKNHRRNQNQKRKARAVVSLNAPVPR
jgi:hypothetical protein